jgi:tetratricopeptide (TPR) repeat protein
MLLGLSGAAWADDWADCNEFNQFLHYDIAIRGCDTIIKSGRESRDDLALAYINRAAAYDNKGDYDRAIADYGNAIKLAPEDSSAYRYRAEVYKEKGDYDRAIADYGKLIKLNPSPSAYENRAHAYAMKGDYNRATADYDKELEFDPLNPWAYEGRADAYSKQGDYERAIPDYDKSIKMQPDNGRAYYGRGVAYAAKADPAKAVTDFRAASQLIPAGDELNQKARGRIADLEKQLATAAPSSADGVIGDSGPEVDDLASSSLPALNSIFDSALAGPEGVVPYDRGSPSPAAPAKAAEWTDCANASGQLDRSIAACTKIIERSGETSANVATAYMNRGVAHGGKGEYDQEISDENKAVELKPDDGGAFYGRGFAYEAKGDFAKALADFRAAAKLIPANDQLHDQALSRLADLEKLLAAPVPAPAAPAPSSRVALVIGNSAYRNVPALNNPVNDANLITEALKTDGFHVTVADNLDRDGLINALKAFATKADAADWAVVYYAGHGIEMVGTNYLIPVDAKLATDRDVTWETISADDIMTAINGAHELRVVILDACRDNPFTTAMKRSTGVFRSIGRGLTRVALPDNRGTVIVYSAKPGQVATDGDGADSPFATALAHHLTDPGVEISKLFRIVGDEVFASTGNVQEVFQDSSLPGKDFFFWSSR